LLQAGTEEGVMQLMEAILETKSREIHVVAYDELVIEAVEVMCRAHVGAVLVMQGGSLAGIFSERDLMTRVVLTGRDPGRTTVADVMSRDVVSIPRDASPRDAMALMTNRRVRHLPVVDGACIVGIVSIGDLVRWTLHDQEEEIGHLYDYVAGRYPG
jgi:CBS domain-containing protein